MMGFGFLFMLLIIVLPVVGIVALILWLSNTNRQGNLFGMNTPPEKRMHAKGPEKKRFCSHCGTGLQAEWTHCPQCGAPVGS